MNYSLIELPTRPTTEHGWLQTLPEPYRHRAVQNCKNPHSECDSQQSALYRIYIYSVDSAQGPEYWNDVYRKSLNGEFRYIFRDQVLEVVK